MKLYCQDKEEKHSIKTWQLKGQLWMAIVDQIDENQTCYKFMFYNTGNIQ